MAAPGALAFVVLLSCLPATCATCFVSEVLGVTACTGQSRVDRGSRGGEERVMLLDSTRTASSNGGRLSLTDRRSTHAGVPRCKCTTEHNPVCLRSTGELVGRNPSCALCDGYPAEALITCSGAQWQQQQQQSASSHATCDCSAADRPVCNPNTGHVMAQNPCLARCSGYDASAWILCESQASDVTQAVSQPTTQRSAPPQMCRCPKNRDPVCDPHTRETLADNECLARCAGVRPAQFVRCRELPPMRTSPPPPPPRSQPSHRTPSGPITCRCPKTLKPVCDRTTHERLADNECLAICAGLGSTRLVPCNEALGEAVRGEEQSGAAQLPRFQPDNLEINPSFCSCPKNIAPVCDLVTGKRLAHNACLARCEGIAENEMVACRDLTVETDGVDASQLPLQPGMRPSEGGECSQDGLSVGEVAGFAACTRLLSKCSGAVAVTGQDGIQVLPLCGTDAQPACLDAAMDFATRSQDCLDFLNGSSEFCDGPVARRLFRETVGGVCRPN